MEKEERLVITEFIELYRDLPCLWDLSCEEYKDQDQKTVAWEILAEKLKTIDPSANIASAKQKIENLKSSYRREVKKVKDSKRKGSSEVHKPSLWYYELMQFFVKKDEHPRREIDPLSSDESQATQIVKKRRHSLLERNKQKLTDTAQEDPLQQSKKKRNSFAVYVGEQLDSLSTQQRHIAEKLISDVIFLGKTENLNFYSRVESNIRSCSTASTHCSPGFPSPQYIKPSPQYVCNAPSPQYNFPSSQYNSPSPQHNTPSPKYISPSQYVSLPIDLIHKILPPSSPHIQTQPTVQSIQCSSPSQQKTQPEGIESPSSPQEYSSSSQSHIETQPTVQSTQNSSPSQHQTQPTETPTTDQISIPSPSVPQTVQPVEETQNIIEAPTGSLLKELLILKNK